jgi:hypothetical protein
MPEWVFVVGLLTVAVSTILLVRPAAIAGLLARVFVSPWLYGAALLRLLLGAALIASADAVNYSQAVALLGWLFVLGALLLVVIPAPVVSRLARRFARLSPAMSRLWLSGALAMGVFLVTAAST